MNRLCIIGGGRLLMNAKYECLCKPLRFPKGTATRNPALTNWASAAVMAYVKLRSKGKR